MLTVEEQHRVPKILIKDIFIVEETNISAYKCKILLLELPRKLIPEVCNRIFYVSTDDSL